MPNVLNRLNSSIQNNLNIFLLNKYFCTVGRYYELKETSNNFCFLFFELHLLYMKPLFLFTIYVILKGLFSPLTSHNYVVLLPTGSQERGVLGTISPAASTRPYVKY